jgi:hypothetical protein
MARCLKCGDLLESKHRHDFITCSCGCLSLDGGLAYRRVLWRGGEYDEVVENYYELVKPIDIQVTANISAKERDNEQEFYQRVYNLLIAEDEKSLAEENTNVETYGIRARDDLCTEGS